MRTCAKFATSTDAALMSLMLGDRYTPSSSTQACLKCTDAQFRGGSTCLIHREEEYEKLIAKPSVMRSLLCTAAMWCSALMFYCAQVRHFLDGDGKNYFPFQEAVKRDVERHIRKCILVLGRYNYAPYGVRKVRVWLCYCS